MSTHGIGTRCCLASLVVAGATLAGASNAANHHTVSPLAELRALRERWVVCASRHLPRGFDPLHKQIGEGLAEQDISVLEGWLLAPDAEIPFPHFSDSELHVEPHPGTYALSLVLGAGVDHGVKLAGATFTVGQIIEGERSKPDYARRIRYVSEELPRRLAVLLETTDETRVARNRRLRREQVAFRPLELSWLIEAIARTMTFQGVPFSQSWRDRAGVASSLSSIIDSQLQMYELDLDTPEFPFLTEEGAHIGRMLALMLSFFADDPGFQSYRNRYEASLKVIVERMLVRETRFPGVWMYADLLIGVHALELLVDPASTVAGELWPSDTRFCDLDSRAGSFVDTLLGELAARADECQGFALRMHVLSTLDGLQTALSKEQPACWNDDLPN